MIVQTEELSVNPSETGLVLLSRKRKVEDILEPNILNTMIHATWSLKYVYLSVTLDVKLTSREHV
jgi:hypothetical protein